MGRGNRRGCNCHCAGASVSTSSGSVSTSTDFNYECPGCFNLGPNTWSLTYPSAAQRCDDIPQLLSGNWSMPPWGGAAFGTAIDFLNFTYTCSWLQFRGEDINITDNCMGNAGTWEHVARIGVAYYDPVFPNESGIWRVVAVEYIQAPGGTGDRRVIASAYYRLSPVGIGQMNCQMCHPFSIEAIVADHYSDLPSQLTICP